jgi:hypothetical protein
MPGKGVVNGDRANPDSLESALCNSYKCFYNNDDYKSKFVLSVKEGEQKIKY